MRDATARRLSRLHIFLYRVTRGVLGRRLVRNDMLLLTTTGSRSGNPHTVPLLFLHDDEERDNGPPADGTGMGLDNGPPADGMGIRVVVIASWGGRPHHPQWYTNLVANPEVTVQVRAKRWRARARTANADERAVWWPRVLAAYKGYSLYESNTDRVIPVVFLEPER